MGKAIRVKQGRPIPLHAQLQENKTTAIIKVYIYNLANPLAPLNGSPIILSHQNDALYTDSSFIMPSIARVIAQYQAFESDGVTPLPPDNVATDVFELDLVGIKPNIKLEIKKGDVINLVIKTSATIKIIINRGEQ